MVYVQEILGMIKACVVIPTFNEAKAIAGLISAVKGYGLEVVVVDDGSQDGTPEIAGQSRATVLKNEHNIGKGASLSKGFAYALDHGFDAVITMDGDGQHLPEEIPYFLRLAEHSDTAIFVGNRLSKKENMPFPRYATNRFMSWLISRCAGQEIADSQCGFRLIKAAALKQVKLRTRKYETESEILIRASRLGMKIESVPVKSVYVGERSHISPFIDTLRFIRFIFGEIWDTRNH